MSRWESGRNVELQNAIECFLVDAAYRIEHGISLALIGPTRSGKTFGLCALIQGLEQRGYTVAHGRMADIISAIRATYARDVEYDEREILNLIARADCIVIDELGFGRLSPEWGVPMLFSIVDAALMRRTPVVFASNYTEGELSESLRGKTSEQDRITPRLFECAQTIFVDERFFSLERRREAELIVAQRNAAIAKGGDV